MSGFASPPRILFITPEVAIVPKKGNRRVNASGARANGAGDFAVALIGDLFGFNVDLYVAQPDYRRLLEVFAQTEQPNSDCKLPDDHLYLAKDRVFFYANFRTLNPEWENIKVSLAFQREVINQIVPRVQPDLIHCYDWMTGLIPAAAQKLSIPCIFTCLTPDSARISLAYVEDIGIDAAGFWQKLFYERYPGTYEQTRDTNPVDLLLSGILAASHVTIGSSAQLFRAAGSHISINFSVLQQVLHQRYKAGCASSHGALAQSPSHSTMAGNSLYHGHAIDQRSGQPKSDALKVGSTLPVDYRSMSKSYIDHYEVLLQRPLISAGNQIVKKQPIKSRMKQQEFDAPFIDRSDRSLEPLFSF